MSTRPSFAPKPAVDIKHIRQNPGLYEQNCIERNYPTQARHSWRILELHDKWKGMQEDARHVREENNMVQRQMGVLRSKGTGNGTAGMSEHSEEVDSLIAKGRELKASLEGIEQEEKQIQAEIDTLALGLPNLSSTFTPNGDEPKLLGYLNQHLLDTHPDGDLRGRTSRPHTAIGADLDLLDFTGSASTSGWGWYFLRNEAALLEQALIQYALHTARTHTSSGTGSSDSKWTVVSPPSIVYSHISSACGFQPRDQNGEQQIYALAQQQQQQQPSNTDDDKISNSSSSTASEDAPSHVLTGTAEIPLAGMHANKLLDASTLPIKTIGPSRCYRAEAGARGASTRGLYRVHEFTKVEMFAWTSPGEGFGARGGGNRFAVDESSSGDESGQYHENVDIENGNNSNGNGNAGPTVTQEKVFAEMLEIQKAILRGLDLPCRVLEMSSMDLGASASRKIDIEAWFPSRVVPGDPSSGWGEVTSVSTCGAYQSRRLATRVKMLDGSRDFPHTVNGTALAVPRVLAAILENGWDEASQSVVIPEVLRNWMGGQERIQKRDV